MIGVALEICIDAKITYNVVLDPARVLANAYRIAPAYKLSHDVVRQRRLRVAQKTHIIEHTERKVAMRVTIKVTVW